MVSRLMRARLAASPRGSLGGGSKKAVAPGWWKFVREQHQEPYNTFCSKQLVDVITSLAVLKAPKYVFRVVKVDY